MITFGDSITVGVGASSPALSWVGLFAPNNQAVSSSQAAEVSNKVLGFNPTIDDEYTLMIGLNDTRKYKNDAAKQSHFEKYFRHCVAWLSLPVKTFARAMTKTGTWTNTPTNNIGLYTTQNGAKLNTTVTGSKIFIGFIIQNYIDTKGTADILIDGVLVGSISCDGYTAPMTTFLNTGFGQAAVCFDVADCEHTIEIINTAPNGKFLFVNYVATNQPCSQLKVSNIYKNTASQYAADGINEATTGAYNAIIADVLCDFPNAILIDNYADIVPATHLISDGHPNDSGYLVIYNNFKTAI